MSNVECSIVGMSKAGESTRSEVHDVRNFEPGPLAFSLRTSPVSLTRAGRKRSQDPLSESPAGLIRETRMYNDECVMFNEGKLTVPDTVFFF